MIIQFRQETVSDINDMVSQIRSEAISLRQRDNVAAISDIIDMTFQVANLIQEGSFVKEEAPA